MSTNEEYISPFAKRRRVDDLAEEPKSTLPQSSRLFSPFRTLGLVSPTSVPFTSIPLGKTTFQISTSVGKSLQTYDLRRGLNLVFLSRPQTPQAITATCSYRDKILVAWGGSDRGSRRGVWVLKRGKLIGELELPDGDNQELNQILVFGSWIVGCGSHSIEVWKSDNYEHYTTITPLEHGGSRNAQALSGCISTLPTFLNKIFVGRQDGQVEIYNVSTGKLVHTILAPSTDSGSVTALTPSSALCILAVAYEDGSVVLHDVEIDEPIMQLRQPGISRSVTSITFRTDGLGAGDEGRKDGIMATASIESGDITFWDLNDGGRVAGVIRGAHEISSTNRSSGVSKIEFLPNQPLLISAGLDNALKSWIFDQTPFSPIPRILHQRSGHAAPVTKLKFLPSASDGSEAAGKWLLSAGQDRSLWGFSLRKDAQSTELSQGNIKHKSKKVGNFADGVSSIEDFKVPPISDIACSLNRDGGMGAIGGAVWTNTKTSNAEEAGTTGWESVVTAHEGDNHARTWFWGRKKAGRWTFETSDHSPVTSVSMTTCGTFALLGSARGTLDMFNLQSGTHRQRYPPRLNQAQTKKLKRQEAYTIDAAQAQIRHSNAVTGIVVDNLNRTVLSSSLDGSVIFWDFLTGQVSGTLSFDSAVPTSMRYNSNSGLVSLACDDLCIRVLDIEMKRIVRELWGCLGQIYDHCFSHDGRWIVACSMDSVVRIFDLATGHLIDAFKTTTCTSVAFSSTGEFLATAHAGSIGINVWNNKSLFMHVPSRQIDEVTGIIDLTGSIAFLANSQLTIDGDTLDSDDDVEQINGSNEIDQLDTALLTLSLVPQSRWQTLINLDSIRQRNRPIAPPEKPKAAPFFLPSSLTIGAKALEDSPPEDQQNGAITAAERSRISKPAALQPSQSRVTALLSSFSQSSNPDPSALVTYLSTLPPSAADLEIRTLALPEMPPFIRALTAQLRLRRDFELVNAWMSVFLRVHGDFIAEAADGELGRVVREWRLMMLAEERRLAELVGYTKGVLDFLRSAR